jgi:hypothetical protein
MATLTTVSEKSSEIKNKSQEIREILKISQIPVRHINRPFEVCLPPVLLLPIRRETPEKVGRQNKD